MASFAFPSKSVLERLLVSKIGRLYRLVLFGLRMLARGCYFQNGCSRQVVLIPLDYKLKRLVMWNFFFATADDTRQGRCRNQAPRPEPFLSLLVGDAI